MSDKTSEKLKALLTEYEIANDRIKTHKESSDRIFGFFSAGICLILAYLVSEGKYEAIIIIPLFITIGHLLLLYNEGNLVQLSIYASKIEEKINKTLGTKTIQLNTENPLGIWGQNLTKIKTTIKITKPHTTLKNINNTLKNTPPQQLAIYTTNLVMYILYWTCITIGVIFLDQKNYDKTLTAAIILGYAALFAITLYTIRRWMHYKKQLEKNP